MTNFTALSALSQWVKDAPQNAKLDNSAKGLVLAELIRSLDEGLAAAKPAKPQSAPARSARKAADTAKRSDRKTTNTEHAYIRLVACELALMDAYEDISDVIPGYSTIAHVPTIGAVDAAYRNLRPYVEAVEITFGRNSAHYAEAKALLA